MKTRTKIKKLRRSKDLFFSLVTAALISNGLPLLITPALADGTAGGTSISNTATATYEDPNTPNRPPITSTSNTVTVTVAEVAGITVTAGTINDSTGGSVQIGDILTYNFTVTNIGNDPTKIRIPSQVTLTGPGTPGTVQYSEDNGTTWTNVSAPNALTNSVPAGGTILVRVPVTVTNAAAAGDIIKVTLGNTSTPDAQNQPLNNTDNNKEVYTEDNANGTVTGEVPGTPANGEREAANSLQTTVDTKDYALATLLKTRTGYSNNNTLTDITDDTLTYGLSFRVENNTIPGTNINPVALQGTTNINVDGSNGTYILISDAIPLGTELNAAPTATDNNWEAVYTTTPVNTNVRAAVWKRFGPGGTLQGGDTLAQVRRVGFINKASLTSVAPGTTITGFSVTVKVQAPASAPLTIANIAQMFGRSVGNDLPVYEESGDNNPSNYNGNTPPIGSVDNNNDGVPDSIPDGAIDDGYITDPNNPETGTDTNNNNTGSGPGGEANVFNINTASILNGPNGQPGALGPDGTNNTDFTNKSSAIPAGTAPGSNINPAPVLFNNTVNNSSSVSGTVTLVPTPPTKTADLPNQTQVTITYNGNSATYTYNGTTFSLTSGTAISIPNVAAGATIDYQVSVDLPGGTPLSTDIERGFPVPITAAIDTNGDNTPDASNITIDRVYTGFLKLVKFSRILQGTGPAVGADQDNFETTPAVNGFDPNPNVADVLRTPQTGNIIEYQIRYKNISEGNGASGSNNVLLQVNNLVITENGTIAGSSNWALDQDNNNIIDTSNVPNSATDSGGSATITYFSGIPVPGTPNATAATTGNMATADVTQYVNSIGVPIDPGVQRTFTFQRKLN
ncbi:MAG: hypothetical protein EAZ76_08570 [Nostocales cyanobacterium]|nr:MAG: hypothetical protein EAZ87_19310 [Nostocales cyanobacterium]TAF15409.1 MAG: hypothetical protein EAZ76_08570 [Nostocales cyanobacterium]